MPGFVGGGGAEVEVEVGAAGVLSRVKQEVEQGVVKVREGFNVVRCINVVCVVRTCTGVRGA